MRDSAKWVSWAIAGIALVGPVPVLGQAISRDDLVGTWRYSVIGGVSWDSAKGPTVNLWENFLTLRSDNTYTTTHRLSLPSRQQTEEGGLPGVGPEGRWSLSGDTLLVKYTVKAIPLAIPLKIARRGPQLLIGNFGSDPQGFAQCGDPARNGWNTTYSFERIDTTKLTPVPPPPVTFKPADLAGTWASNKPDYPRANAAGRIADTLGRIADTLILRANGTWTAKAASAAEGGKMATEGKWAIVPGDILMLVDSQYRTMLDGVRRPRVGPVKLQGQQMIFGWDCYPVPYDRLGPPAP